MRDAENGHHLDFASEQTSVHVHQRLEKLGDRPHPRDVLRLTLAEMLPLHADARATSRTSAAYGLEALHDQTVQEQAPIASFKDGLPSSSWSAKRSPTGTYRQPPGTKEVSLVVRCAAT
ncbi:hypothetical protein [Streptomyces monomycini]|uniref:hypothetical protein n=1 Tax=Streptomyces monomycini TaxID=371720 RepID=UPI001EEB29A6|nr:hypothetical protein [Streptomyces monomycini]